MKNYEKLKKVIQEAVPEIMKLKFGCEIYVHYNVEGRIGKRILIAKPAKSGFAPWLSGAVQTKNEGNYRIIGRPIRLADVLMATQKGAKHIYINDVVDNWNLKDNNLDHQSDETKELLIKLLVNLT